MATLTGKSGRITYIDIAKGLAMILIIWGHIRLNSLSQNFAYVFDIPLFFFLSGLTFNQKKYDNLWQLIRKRFYTLLIPYAIFSVVTWVVWAAYNFVFRIEVESYWMPLLQTLISQGPGGYLEHNASLWFVTCLFVVEILYYFICKLKPGFCLLTCVGCAVLGVFMIGFESPFRNLPWSIDVAFCAIPFYAIGNQLSQRFSFTQIGEVIRKKKVVSITALVILFAIVILCAYFNGYVTMGGRHLNKVYIFYPAACAGIVMALIFSVLLSGWKGKVMDFICWFGTNSFYAMAVQKPISGIILVVFGKLLHKSTDDLRNNGVYSLIALVTSFVCVVITLLLINWFKKEVRKKFTKKEEPVS